MIRSWWVRVSIAGAAMLAVLAAGAGLLRQHTIVVARTITVGTIANAATIAPESGRVFIINSGSDSVSILDTRTGALLTTTRVGHAPAVAGVDETTGRVFVPDINNDSVSILDVRTGGLVRTVFVGRCPSDVDMAAHSGRVFVFNYDTHRTISMLDARTGVFLGVVDPPGSDLFSFVPDINADDSPRRIFVMSYDPVTHRPSVTVLDGANGHVRGVIRLDDGQTPLAVDTRHNRLVVSTASGVVSLLTATSGRLVGGVRLHAQPAATAVDPARGRIILIDQTMGTVTILDEATGALLRTIGVPGVTGPIAIDPQTGRILVAGDTTTAAGRVTIVDGARGRVVGSVAVGQTPAALAVDARTGRTFVVNEGGAAPPQPSWWEDRAQGLRHWLPWLPWPSKHEAPPSVLTSSVSVLDGTR